MSTLNQDAPPAEAPKGGNADFIKLPAFPRSDSYVATITAINYIPSFPFDRTDEKTGQKSVVPGPGIEFFFGALVDGNVCFVKSWPKYYSVSDRAAYHKWYKAALGKAPVAGSKPSELIGSAVLLQLECKDKVGKKGTAYVTNNIVNVSSVPSVLKSVVTPLEKLLPTLQDVLAGQGEE